MRWPSSFVGRAAVTFAGQKRKCTAAFMDRTVVTFVGQNRKWNTALLASIGVVTPLDLNHTKTENATSTGVILAEVPSVLPGGFMSAVVLVFEF